MQLKNILNNTIRFSGLSLLLLSLNSCSNSPKDVVENYLKCLGEGDENKIRDYCSDSKITRDLRNGIPSWIALSSKNHYRDAEVKSYIDHEGEVYGQDRDDIVWIVHKDGDYHQVQLVKENGNWKVDLVINH